MWKDILKASPITIGSTKIRLKPIPDEEECCEQARKEWIEFRVEREKGLPRSNNNYLLYHTNFIEGRTCEYLYDSLIYWAEDKDNNFNQEWKEAAQEILDKWNKCEGK